MYRRVYTGDLYVYPGSGVMGTWVSIFLTKRVWTNTSSCVYAYVYTRDKSAQGWRNRTLAVHERVNSRF